MAHRATFTAQLSAADKAALSELAESIGLTHTRGTQKGRGSIRQLLLNLASGDAIFMLLADDLEYALAPRLRQLADEMERENRETGLFRDLLRGVAGALDRAGRLFDES